MAFFTWLKARRKTAEQPKGVLGRLRRDQRGATLAMMAASIIPMVGIVGSAVDMSRAYLVKTRLQQACDAGALAARRVMTGSALDANARTQGSNFFNINLAQGAYGATNITVAYSDALENGKTVGVVHGDATADVPTTLMRIFGKTQIEMTAQCEAQLNVANNDIMFVLDVTGSMSCLPSDSVTTCQGYAGSSLDQNASGRWYNVEKSGSRIDGLRDAVKDFFSTVKAATSSSARLRIGFVPFSSGVNVGYLLRDGVPNSLSSGPIFYQSRKAVFNQPVHVGTEGTTTTSTEVYGSNITQANCTNYGKNIAFTGFSPSPSGATTTTGGPPPATTFKKEYSNVASDWGYSGSTPTTGTTRKCRRTVKTTPTTYVTRYSSNSWTYDRYSYDPSDFADGTAVALANITSSTTVPAIGSYTVQELVTLAGAQGFTTTPYVWDGCIEERLTGSADIDSAPSSEANRWRPAWQTIEYTRSTTPAASGTQAGGSSYTTVPNYSCPKASTRLAEMTQAQVDAYVDGSDFFAHGQTYHDIGMIWGARLMSPNGLFSADHGAAPNGKPVNRHIIFMTDGDMDPSLSSYSSYGIENLDRRILPTGTLSEGNLEDAHNARFLAACQAAKDRGISVWVVGFATGLTAELTACADANQAFTATSTAELRSRFQTIAQRIAELRLSK